MKDLFTLPIPVYSYVKKYLNTLHGEIYIISLNDSIGVFLSTMLEKDAKHINYQLKVSEKTTLYTVAFSEKILQRQGFTTTPKKRKYIGDLLDKYFREQCYSFILHDSVGKKDNYKTSLKNFLKVYDITDEELDPESLYKDFMRRKNGKSQNYVSKLAKQISRLEKCPL